MKWLFVAWCALCLGCSSSDDGLTLADANSDASTDVSSDEEVGSGDTGPADEIIEESCLDGESCDDGNPCTEGEICNRGVCAGGVAKTCDAGGPCQTGSCDASTGQCIYVNLDDGATCEMGCFEEATCQQGVCTADSSTAVVCPTPDDPCVASYACDPSTNACTLTAYKSAGTACDVDANVCTLDVCNADGVCEPTGGVNDCAAQENNNPCWTYVCNGKSGCVQSNFLEGASCDDGNACSSNDLCIYSDVGWETCVGTPFNVDDGNPCTDDACLDGAITHTPIVGATCTPDSICSDIGVCGEDGKCEPTETCECAVDADCGSPTDLCSGVLRCDTEASPPACVLDTTQAVICDSPTNPCETSTCEPSTGECVVLALADGVSCEDGNACTQGDVCDAGQCQAGQPLECEVATPCQSGSCDPISGVCTYDAVADGSPCTAPCFETATCESGVCIVDTDSALECPDSEDPCIESLACDPASGTCSLEVFAPEGTTCDADEGVCSIDTCDGEGSCASTGESESCAAESAANPCQIYSCDDALGCVAVGFLEGASCDDDNPCTYSDTCTTSGDFEGCLGTPLPIDDSNPCTDDACIGGEITHTPIVGISCTPDSICSDTGTCDAQGQCEPDEACACFVDSDCAPPSDLCSGTMRCDTEASPPACVLDTSDAVVCAPSVNPCLSVGCDPGTGECVTSNQPDGIGCNDNDPCTSGDSCAAGVCGGTGCGPGQVCDGAQGCVAACTPVDGGWTDWSWGACSVSCGGGVMSATRSCTSPSPSCGGQACAGPSTDSMACNTEPCAWPTGIRYFTTSEQVEQGPVPPGVYSLTACLWGGGGGGGFPGHGGGGASVCGVVSVNPGDQIEVRVGGAGQAHGAGGGASYLFINGVPVMVAAGGGGAGSDGCSGCSFGVGGAANGGAGGGVGQSGGAGDGNTKYSTNSGGGSGGSPSSGGAGGVSNDQSVYSGCTGNGSPGGNHAGGDGFGGSSCGSGSQGASWHNAGVSSNGNGTGGGGGGGYWGGGGGSGKYTYSGGGGGGGASFIGGVASLQSSESGAGRTPGGTGHSWYQGEYGKGGHAGDHTNWPSNYFGPGDGASGMVVTSL